MQQGYFNGNDDGYVFRKAYRLGESSNLNVFVDQDRHIVWLREGLTPVQEYRACFDAGRIIQLQSPSPENIHAVPIVGEVG